MKITTSRWWKISLHILYSVNNHNIIKHMAGDVHEENPIGLKDYRKLKEENYYVVDKSLMIKEFMDRGSEVTLITRPRRFGKTINMSRRCPPMACWQNSLMSQRTPGIFSRTLLLCKQNMQRISIHIRLFFYPSQMQRVIRIILSCRWSFSY